MIWNLSTNFVVFYMVMFFVIVCDFNYAFYFIFFKPMFFMVFEVGMCGFRSNFKA